MESGILIENACLTLFVVISFLNLGLLAIDANEQLQGTGVSILQGQQLSGQITLEQMSSKMGEAVQQSEPQQDLTAPCVSLAGLEQAACIVNAYMVGAVHNAVSVANYLIAGLGMLWSVGSFIISNFLPGSAAYWQLLNQIAVLLEGTSSAGPIHLLFNGIASIIYLVYMFGLFYFLQIIAGVVRG